MRCGEPIHDEHASPPSSPPGRFSGFAQRGDLRIERTRLELRHAVEALHGNTGGEHVEGRQQGADSGGNRQATDHGGLKRLVVGARGGRGEAGSSPWRSPDAIKTVCEVLSKYPARGPGPNSFSLYHLPPPESADTVGSRRGARR